MVEAVNKRSALSVVEEKYGSLEDLALYILEERREALDETLPLAKRAEAVGLPMLVFARVLADPAFRQLLRADLVNRAFTLAEEEHHIRQMVKVAIGEPKTVVTNKGNLVEVDQSPTDVIAAGRYLNELRGTPIEGKRESAFRGVVVNFENVQVSFGAEPPSETVEAYVHRPRRAGELPSGSGHASADAPARLPAVVGPGADAGLGAFYGDGAKEADEAHALARAEASREEGAMRPEQPYDALLKRRGLWPGTKRQHARRVDAFVARRPPYED